LPNGTCQADDCTSLREEKKALCTRLADLKEEEARAYGEKTAADAREEELLQLSSSIAAEEEDAAIKLEASAAIAAQVSDPH